MEELYVVIRDDVEDGLILCWTALEEQLFYTKEQAQDCIDYIVKGGWDASNYRIAKLSFLD